MDLGLDLYALIVILSGLAIGSFVKGLTGTGLPLVAVPFMAGFLGAEHAIVVLQIPGLVSNMWLIWSNRRQAREVPLRYDMIVPAAVMTVVGVVFLDLADNTTIILLLAALVAVFLVLLLINPSLHLSGTLGRIVTPLAGMFGGFSQGATGVSGPLFSTLILSFRLPKEAFVYYNGIVFGLFNLIQVVVMIFLGMLTGPRFVESLLALIPMVVFQYIGMRTMSLVSLRVFNRVVVVVIVLMEVKLVWQSLYG